MKQAPKQWHEKFDQVVLSYGFQINNTDKCVYVKQFDDNGCVILCLYMDDILIFGSNMQFINDVKSFLSRNFDMKDLGPVDVILGIKLIKKNDGMILTPSTPLTKINDILKISSFLKVLIIEQFGTFLFFHSV